MTATQNYIKSQNTLKRLLIGIRASHDRETSLKRFDNAK